MLIQNRDLLFADSELDNLQFQVTCTSNSKEIWPDSQRSRSRDGKRPCMVVTLLRATRVSVDDTDGVPGTIIYSYLVQLTLYLVR